MQNTLSGVPVQWAGVIYESAENTDSKGNLLSGVFGHILFESFPPSALMRDCNHPKTLPLWEPYASVVTEIFH